MLCKHTISVYGGHTGTGAPVASPLRVALAGRRVVGGGDDAAGVIAPAVSSGPVSIPAARASTVVMAPMAPASRVMPMGIEPTEALELGGSTAGEYDSGSRAAAAALAPPEDPAGAGGAVGKDAAEATRAREAAATAARPSYSA